MTKRFFSFWDNLGFLNGLNDEDAKNVAKLMEDMAVYLLDSEGKYELQVIETIVFPMIRRAYTNGGMSIFIHLKECVIWLKILLSHSLSVLKNGTIWLIKKQNIVVFSLNYFSKNGNNGMIF